MQKGYGDTPDRFLTRLKGFLWALESYPMPMILAAFRRYVRANGDIPSPADIVKIIDPPPPALSPTRYVSLCKRERDGFMLFGEDLAYKRAFEEQENAKQRGGTPLLRECRQRIDAEAPLSIGCDGDGA